MAPDKALIRDTWRVAEPVHDRIAHYIFSGLFAARPHTRTMFPVALDTLRRRYMASLGRIVQLLDDEVELERFVRDLGREHRRYGVQAEHYDAMGEALLGALRTNLRSVWTKEAHDAWAELYRAIAYNMAKGASDATEPATYSGTVIDYERHGDNVAIVKLLTEPALTFEPGQYVDVETPRRPRLWRPMSMAAPQNLDGVIEFHVKAVPGGAVSGSIVSETRLGDVWRLGAPQGSLRAPLDTGRDVLMVAGGVGVAPMLAMLNAMSGAQRMARVQLFYGTRYDRDRYASGMLRYLRSRNPWIEVIEVVSGPGERPEYPIVAGRLPDVVERRGRWTRNEIIVAGSPRLIGAVNQRMAARGVPLNTIHHDPIPG